MVDTWTGLLGWGYFYMLGMMLWRIYLSWDGV